VSGLIVRLLTCDGVDDGEVPSMALLREAAAADGWHCGSTRDLCPACRSPEPVCGTDAAYHRHLYRREEPDADCRRAHAQKQKAWKPPQVRRRRQPASTAERSIALKVAGYATDAEDCRALLEALGLLPEPSAAEPLPQDDGRSHGRPATYRDGCRCEECRAANAARHKAWRRRTCRNPASADRAGHGKASTYNNHGCRCTGCTDAHMARITEYRQRRVQAA
jgi:hypothetical protein